MESISEALKLVDVKKENLRKAFETLQARYPSLPSFNLTWSDLESHFSSQISSLQSNLDLLQCQRKPQFPELTSLCQNMDGLGLITYLMKRFGVRTTTRAEMRCALRCASDPAALVLVAVEGYHEPSPTGNRISERDRRWSCVMMLEELAALKPEIGAEVKEKAKNLAEEWKKKTTVSAEDSLACLGFLYLVAAYGLADCVDMPVLLDFAFVFVANESQFEKAVKFCRVLSLNVPDLISKLMTTGKELLAIKFIFEFKLTDKFPPVPILEKYVELSKKLSESERAKETGIVSLTKVAAKEVYLLRSVIKIIEEYKLQSEYPKEELLKHIEFVEEEARIPHSSPTPTSKPPKKANTKLPRPNKHSKSDQPGDTTVASERVSPPAPKPPQQEVNPQDLSGSKHPKSDQPGDRMVNSKKDAPPGFEPPQKQVDPQEPNGSKHLKSDEPGDKMVNSERVSPPGFEPPQQQVNPQELSGSKHLKSDQPGDTTVNSEKDAPPGFEHPQQQAKLQEPSGSKRLKSDHPGDKMVNSEKDAPPGFELPQQQANPQELSGSKHLKSDQPGDKMVNSERDVPPGFEPPQQHANPQELSGSKHLENDQPGDKIVNSKRVAPPGFEPQEQSGSKRLKSDQPGDTTVASERVTNESIQSEPKPPDAEQVGHEETVAVSSNYSAFRQSHLQPAGTTGPWPAHAYYAGSTAGPYNWGGPCPNIAPNMGPFASMYGSSRGPFSIPGNLRPPGPHVYPHEPPPPVGYFPVPDNGYGLRPQYRQW